MSTPRKPKSPAALPAGLEAETRINLDQLSILTGKKKTKLYADIKAGLLPEPERSGKRCSRWRVGSVLAAMNGGAA